MGWSVIPEPGTKYGPCLEPCEHRDCAEWKAVIDAPCPLCGEPLKPGQGVMWNTDPDTPAHVGCVWRKHEEA